MEPPPVDRVIVAVAHQDHPGIVERLAAYERYLTDDELARAARFFQAADTARFVIGRTLARTLLSRYAPVAPRDWPLVIDAHGRPELAHRPPGAPDLRFNVSHTNGLVACAVTVGREVGVDVEHTTRNLLHDIAERFFSPREVADLRARPEAEQAIAFFDYWTLKESYIKARGLGLALPLRQFSFLLHQPTPTIAFAPELHDDPATWQFAQFWPTAHHRMAVAVRRRGKDLPIEVDEAIPDAPAEHRR
jgi:4'-phosphopantetheinyl transferase